MCRTAVSGRTRSLYSSCLSPRWGGTWLEPWVSHRPTPSGHLRRWIIFCSSSQAADDYAPIDLEKHLGQVDRPFKENVTRYDSAPWNRKWLNVFSLLVMAKKHSSIHVFTQTRPGRLPGGLPQSGQHLAAEWGNPSSPDPAELNNTIYGCHNQWCEPLCPEHPV